MCSTLFLTHILRNAFFQARSMVSIHVLFVTLFAAMISIFQKLYVASMFRLRIPYFRMEFIDVSNEERLYGSLGFDFDSLGCMQ